jgi:uncharacterized protein (TIGR02246 family)
VHRAALPLLAAVLAACAGGTASTRTDPASIDADIRKIDREWVKAIADKDLDKIVGYYADDARFMPPNAPPAVGRDQIRSAWDGFLKTPGLQLNFEPTVVRSSPDGQMAYDVGTYTFEADRPNGRQHDEGKYTQIWQRRDGNWKVVVDMVSSNLPAAPPPAAPPPPH